MTTRRALSRREGEELCFTKSSRHSTCEFHTSESHTRTSRLPPAIPLCPAIPRCELRIDRRVRADLAGKLSSPAENLTDGVRAERSIHVRREVPLEVASCSPCWQEICKAI